MKKILALLLAALIVCALPVVAMAAKNPSSEKVFQVTVQKGAVDGQTADKSQVTVAENGAITMKAVESAGKFNSWKVYKAVDATAAAAANVKYVEATANVDYVIVSGSLTESTITIKPLTDIVVCGNYDGKITDPQTGNASSVSDKTGYNFALLAVVCVLAVAGAGVAAKKAIA